MPHHTAPLITEPCCLNLKKKHKVTSVFFSYLTYFNAWFQRLHQAKADALMMRPPLSKGQMGKETQIFFQAKKLNEEWCIKNFFFDIYGLFCLWKNKRRFNVDVRNLGERHSLPPRPTQILYISNQIQNKIKPESFLIIKINSVMVCLYLLFPFFIFSWVFPWKEQKIQTQNPVLEVTFSNT